MNIEVSIGEIVDKLTILQIKNEMITDEVKLMDIVKEFNYLKKIVTEDIGFDLTSEEYNDLLDINKRLWIIEDKIRDKEKLKEFDDEFIELARNVYFTNDIRASQKKLINLKLGSNFIEHKSYSEYK
jgi:hypothetical protein